MLKRLIVLDITIFIMLVSACSAQGDHGSAGTGVDSGHNNWNSTNNSDGGSSNTNNGYSTTNNNTNGQSGTGVNIGGAQDFGMVRKIVENGGIPSSDLLDPNGFFSEHYLQLPPADCDHSVCLYTMLARGRNVLSNDFMTVLGLTMISPIKPGDLQRPATDFVFVLDHSGSMYIEDKLEYMKQGLVRMLDELSPGDRVSLIVYDHNVEILSDLVDLEENRENLKYLVNNIAPGGQTDIYDALETGFAVIESRPEEEMSRPARLIFLSDGQPTAGITDSQQILEMATSHVGPMVNLTSIGVGSDINYDLMKNLAMEGGNFYFVEDAASLLDIFTEEANYFPVPIAENARLDLAKGNHFRLGSPVGFPNWTETQDGGYSLFPNLYLASRTTEETENSHARRGGGSIMFMKMVPEGDTPSIVGLHALLSYDDPQDATTVTINYEYTSYFGTEMLPVENEYFSDVMAIKSFAVLNAWLALSKSLNYVENGEPCTAVTLLDDTANYLQERSDQLIAEGAASGDGDDDLMADRELLIHLAYNISIQYYCGEIPDNGGWDTPPDHGDYEGTDGDYVVETRGCSATGGTPSPIMTIMVAMALLLAAQRRRTTRNHK